MEGQQEIVSRFQQLQTQINQQAKFAVPQLIAVSKTFSNDHIKVVMEQNHWDFGENKVQELSTKSLALTPLFPQVRWHFIGRLQRNKVAKLLKVPHLVMIHSIDSCKLIEALYQEAARLPVGHVEFLLQVNTSGEEEKGGFTTAENLLEAMALINDLQKKLSTNSMQLRWQGLMTMSSWRSDDFEKSAHHCFQELVQIRNDLQPQITSSLKLSFGMSSDFSVALQYPTDYLRIGRQIFGERKV